MLLAEVVGGSGPRTSIPYLQAEGQKPRREASLVRSRWRRGSSTGVTGPMEEVVVGRIQGGPGLPTLAIVGGGQQLRILFFRRQAVECGDHMMPRRGASPPARPPHRSLWGKERRGGGGGGERRGRGSV